MMIKKRTLNKLGIGKNFLPSQRCQWKTLITLDDGRLKAFFQIKVKDRLSALAMIFNIVLENGQCSHEENKIKRIGFQRKK